jgi:hypothetical protein
MDIPSPLGGDSRNEVYPWSTRRYGWKYSTGFATSKATSPASSEWWRTNRNAAIFSWQLDARQGFHRKIIGIYILETECPRTVLLTGVDKPSPRDKEKVGRLCGRCWLSYNNRFLTWADVV